MLYKIWMQTCNGRLVQCKEFCQLNGLTCHNPDTDPVWRTQMWVAQTRLIQMTISWHSTGMWSVTGNHHEKALVWHWVTYRHLSELHGLCMWVCVGRVMVASASVFVCLCRSRLFASEHAYILTFHKPATKCHVQRVESRETGKGWGLGNHPNHPVKSNRDAGKQGAGQWTGEPESCGTAGNAILEAPT